MRAGLRSVLKDAGEQCVALNLMLHMLQLFVTN